MSKPPLVIKQLPLSALRPYARNARTHSPKQIAQIAASISEFGFNNGAIKGGRRAAPTRATAAPCGAPAPAADVERSAPIRARYRYEEEDR